LPGVQTWLILVAGAEEFTMEILREIIRGDDVAEHYQLRTAAAGKFSKIGEKG